MKQCQICTQESEDCRTLRLQYLYELSEISSKLNQEVVTIQHANTKTAREDTFWSIRTCKDCRSDFLGILRRWASGEFVTRTEDDPQRNIPVRTDGRVVMMTTKEWRAHTARLGELKPFPYRISR